MFYLDFRVEISIVRVLQNKNPRKRKTPFVRAASLPMKKGTNKKASRIGTTKINPGDIAPLPKSAPKPEVQPQTKEDKEPPKVPWERDPFVKFSGWWWIKLVDACIYEFLHSSKKSQSRHEWKSQHHFEDTTRTRVWHPSFSLVSKNLTKVRSSISDNITIITEN